MPGWWPLVERGSWLGGVSFAEILPVAKHAGSSICRTLRYTAYGGFVFDLGNPYRNREVGLVPSMRGRGAANVRHGATGDFGWVNSRFSVVLSKLSGHPKHS